LQRVISPSLPVAYCHRPVCVAHKHHIANCSDLGPQRYL
jgi:hypothetical protein